MSGFGIGRDRESAGEEDVALNVHAERQFERGKFFQAEGSEFREAQVGEAEASIVVRVKLGCEPGADADGIEEFDHWDVVAAGLAAVGKELIALVRRQQGDGSLGRFIHRLAPRRATANAVRPPDPSRLKAPSSWLGGAAPWSGDDRKADSAT